MNGMAKRVNSISPRYLLQTEGIDTKTSSEDTGQKVAETVFPDLGTGRPRSVCVYRIKGEAKFLDIEYSENLTEKRLPLASR